MTLSSIFFQHDARRTMKKLKPAEVQAVLDLMEALSDPTTTDDIVLHEVETPYDAEEDGYSVALIIARGEFRELIENRKAILRDVVATLRIAFDERK